MRAHLKTSRGSVLLLAAALFSLSGCALRTSGNSDFLDESQDPEIPDGEDLEIDTAQDPDIPESEDAPEIEPDIPPSCGDGVVDEGEECDDGNGEDGDGCDGDCTYSCRGDEECRDADSCNGQESCDEELHRCMPGDPAADGVVCVPDPRSICLEGACRVSECGDGYVDAGGGEMCEPAHDPDCRDDCTYECTVDSDCPDDGEPCNGQEYCDMTEGVCGRQGAPADGAECGESSVPREICIGGICLESACGDSFVDTGADPAEECDDGNDVDTDDCTSACLSASCGDGYVHTGVEACDGDDPLGCDTTCGSTGTQACVDCGWADCAPPDETCNALDDDCDGEADETFPCVAGSSVACTNLCGGAGTGTCTDGCQLPAPSDCSAPPETCNGEDDDCDGRTDEDFVLESDPLNCGACGVVCPEACVRGACAIARCDDGVMNGDETDVDCGGLECRGCIGGLACTYGSDCESGLCQTGLCVTGCNVIVNGSAELGGSGTSIPGWTVLQNGGDGWRVETGYAPPPTERANHNFVTSYSWDRKGQLVDLRTLGFSTVQLGLRPNIYVCDWVRRRWDGVDSQTDYYYLRAELRDSGGTAFSTWTRGSTGSPIGTTSDSWVLEQNTFSGYTSSLAFVYLEHGGHDGEYWIGWYGTKFDGARITVLGIPCPSCSDGVQNQNEAGTDCGGICAACP